MKVKLISKTMISDEDLLRACSSPDKGEDLVAYCARVSNPNNQHNFETAHRLLKYCAKHGHFSVFEMFDLTMEIQTSRAISAQILRHKSFSFQEFSQRYSQVNRIELYAARRQDETNRQNSIDDMSVEDKQWFYETQLDTARITQARYQEALQRGVAKEQARMLLPMGVQTRMYMKGSARSWIHYCQVRTDPSTQLEHREIAEKCKDILLDELPSIAGVFEG